MNINEYLDKKAALQNKILKYFDSNEDNEENYETLVSLFTDQNIQNDPNELKSLLHLLSKICDNHNRGNDLYSRTTKILNHFKKEIGEYFTNLTIFSLFKNNKTILLFLIEEKYLIIDEDIIDKMKVDKYKKAKYLDYFMPEIKLLQTKDSLNETPENDSDFDEKRRKGENENIICKYIQDDMIDDFITYVNKNDIKVTSIIEDSIFETNSFLIKSKKTTLIEYAAFFGSIQIFKYLFLNKAKLKPSLWLYAIHGQNPEIIHLLEEQKIKPEDESYQAVFEEAIKCHHNDIAKYILDNYINDKNTESTVPLRSYNYLFIEKESINASSFYNLCKYDYYKLVNFMLTNEDVDINEVHSNTINSVKIFTVTEEDPPFDVEVDQEKDINETALSVSVERGNDGIVSLLLSNDKIDANLEYITTTREMPPNDSFDPNKYESTKTVLAIAVENKDTRIVDLLLKNKTVNPNIMCKNLIDHSWGPGEKPEYEIKTEKTPLYIAVENEDDIMVQLLLNCDQIDVNANCKYSSTYYKFVPKKLGDVIAFGGYVNGFSKAHQKYNNIEQTALHCAVEKGNVKIVELLLQNENIDINAIYKNTNDHDWQNNEKFGEDKDTEKTALCIAVENSFNDIVRLLLENEKIDVNIPCITTKKSFKWIQNEDAGDSFSYDYIVNSHLKSDIKSTQEKKSVLHIAVENKNIDLIKMLLNSNINIDSIDYNGKKPVEYTNNEEIIILLSH